MVHAVFQIRPDRDISILGASVADLEIFRVNIFVVDVFRN
jgi:hypothetical protein